MHGGGAGEELSACVSPTSEKASMAVVWWASILCAERLFWLLLCAVPGWCPAIKTIGDLLRGFMCMFSFLHAWTTMFVRHGR